MKEEKEINKLVEILWNYHKLNMKPKKSDLIFVLGSNDIRIAKYSAELFNEGWAPYLLFSGGISHNDDVLATPWKRPEAEVFTDVAIKAGVTKDKILVENKATNTGENISFSYELIKNKGLNVSSIILVQKPFMERRTYATFKKQWPEKGVKICVQSPPMSWKEFPNKRISKELFIHTIVGDTQRIKLYAEQGYQIPQEMPDKVWSAYESLVKLGYDKHLAK